MLKISLLVFFWVISLSASLAQCSFGPLGPDDFKQASFSSANNFSMTTGPDNYLYVLFSDGNESGKLTVRKYNGTAWETIGVPGFTSRAVTDPTSIAVANNGSIYVAYKDIDFGRYLSVMKYDGNAWVLVGAQGLSGGFANSISIAIDPNNVPYVCYSLLGGDIFTKKFNGSAWVNIMSGEYKGGGILLIDHTGAPCVAFGSGDGTAKASVVKYNGTQWNFIGASLFSTTRPTDLHFSISKNGTYYISYVNNSDELIVQKFDGTSWVFVGSQGFPGIPVLDHSLVADKNGTPYVAFKDIDLYSYKTTVMKFNGTNWVYFDGHGASSHASNSPFLATDNNGKIYLGCKDHSKLAVFNYDQGDWPRLGETVFDQGGYESLSMALAQNKQPYVSFKGYNGELVVMSYINKVWAKVGHPGFTTGITDGLTAIALNSQDVPYLAYQDEGDKQITVKKFDGTNWTTVGLPGFSQGPSEYITIAIDPFDTPHVAYVDYSNQFRRLTVMKFNGTEWITVGLPRFSQGDCTYPNLMFTSTGALFVGFGESGNGTVWKFSNNVWSSINNMTGIGIKNYKATAIDAQDRIYFAYSNSDRKITIRRYNGTGTSWSTLGTSNFVTYLDAQLSLAIDNNSIPYVVYRDVEMAKLSIAKFASNTWTAHSTCISPTTIENPVIGIGSNNTPIVVYYSGGLFAKGNNCDVVTDTKEPNDANSKNDLLAYPNPTRGLITIDLKTESTVIIANSLGQVIVQQTFLADKHELNISDFPSGIYIIKISGKDNDQSIKLLKQD